MMPAGTSTGKRSTFPNGKCSDIKVWAKTINSTSQNSAATTPTPSSLRPLARRLLGSCCHGQQLLLPALHVIVVCSFAVPFLLSLICGYSDAGPFLRMVYNVSVSTVVELFIEMVIIVYSLHICLFISVILLPGKNVDFSNHCVVVNIDAVCFHCS